MAKPHNSPRRPPGAPPAVPRELLEFTLPSCELLAFKLKALNAFGSTEYQYWVQKLVDDKVIAAKDFDSYQSLLSRWHKLFDKGPKRKRPRPARKAADGSRTAAAKRPRSQLRWSNERMKRIFPALAQHVHATAPTLPDQILRNLELLIPDAIYHALYAKMKMTADRVADINEKFFGDRAPDQDTSAAFNIFRYSCEPGHPIAHGTLTVSYNAATRAHKTVERYFINNTPYRVTGSLVQPDSSYRIFSTHEGSDTTVAQVMLVAPAGTTYLGRDGHEHLKGQLRELSGVVLDVHKPNPVYVTRVFIRRPDKDHDPLDPGTMPSDSNHAFYRQHAGKLPLLEYVQSKLVHKNLFDHRDIIGFR